MSTIETATVPVTTERPGFIDWVRGMLLRLFVASSPSGGAASLHEDVHEDGTASEFVLAPGGYRIRVPHPSDVGNSVGEMLPSVKEGLLLLPPLPSVVVELLREIQDPKSTAASVAEVASSDPALAASLLRTANGAAMGLSRTITSVGEAVSYLGFATVKAMVIRLRLDEVLMPKTEQAARDAEDLWVHSLAVSYAAECLAKRVQQVDHGFVATLGLLHDIGKLAILAQLPDQAASLQGDAASDEAGGTLARKARVLGVDHAGLGANLAAKWKLPADLVQAIRWHHRPANGFHPTDPLALRKALHVVQIANQLVKYCYSHADQMQIDTVPDEAFKMLGLPASLSNLLDGKMRTAISRAIYFADGSTRRPAAAPRRFLRPLVGKDAACALAAAPGTESRVVIDDALVAELFSAEAPDLCNEHAAHRSRDLALHARFVVTATAAGIQRCLAAAASHQEDLQLASGIRCAAAMTIKSILPNLQALCSPEDQIQVVQKQSGTRFTLAVRAPGLATARRFTAADASATRKLAEADLANLLNLGWFQQIAVSTDGATVVFVGD